MGIQGLKFMFTKFKYFQGLETDGVAKIQGFSRIFKTRANPEMGTAYCWS